MLVSNAFLEFRDLLYVMGRIEDGVKKGRIVNAEARMPEKRKNVFDKHARATSLERKSKKKFNE